LVLSRVARCKLRFANVTLFQCAQQAGKSEYWKEESITFSTIRKVGDPLAMGCCKNSIGTKPSTRQVICKNIHRSRGARRKPCAQNKHNEQRETKYAKE
jgi:hypothetical protein